MLTIRNLSFQYGSIQTLTGVDMTISQGEVTCILGRNGVGKTTLLKNIMGTLRSTVGSVVMDGLDLTIGRRIWITRDPLSTVSPSDIVASPRIGVSRAQDAELRFFVNGSPFVSGPRRRFSTRVRKMSG